MPMNCGLTALSQLAELKNISAFTLVHAARDNGLNLFVFKVNDLSDLPKVQRPCIFHQEDHFVYIKNGEPMPIGKYTGYVIGGAVLGRVIGLSEAKFIKGGKNVLTGKNKDGVQEGSGLLGIILPVVASIALPIIGPAIGLGAGGLGLSASALGGVGGALGGAGGAALSGGNPLVGGVLGGIGGIGIGGGVGAVQGANAAAKLAGGVAPTLAQNAGNFLGGVGSSLSHPINAVTQGAALSPSAASLATQTAGFGGGVSNAFNATGGAIGHATAIGSDLGASTLGGAIGSSLANTANTPAMSLTNGGVGNASGNAITPSTSSPASIFTSSQLAGAASVPSLTAASNTGGGGFGGLNLSTAASLAGAAGIFGSKPPVDNSPSPSANYSAVNTFLGSTPQGQANNTFGLASVNANTDVVNTPIADLQKSFTANNQRTLDTINTAYDNQKQGLVHQYAQAGQNLANSSELQDKVGQLEQKRVNDLTLAQQELQDQALGQAISVKQQALSAGMQAGQFDQNLAMELASLTGSQQELQATIANNDYNGFQQIMGKLLTMGIPQSVSITNNGNTSTMNKQGGI